MKTTKSFTSLPPFTMLTPIFLSESRVLVCHGCFGSSGLLVADLEQRVLLFAPLLAFFHVFSHASDGRGRMLVSGNIVGGREDGHGLYLVQAQGTEPQALFWTRSVEDETICSPAFSPSGRDVLFSLLNGERMGTYCLRTGRRRPLCLAPEGFDPCWSPNGSCLAFTRYSQESRSRRFVHLVSVSGSLSKRLCEGHSPCWSPVGTRIAFVLDRERYHSQIGCMGADGQECILLTPEDSRADFPLWLPDGQNLCFFLDNHCRLLNLSTRKSTMVIRPLEGTFYPVAASPDGRYLSFVEEMVDSQNIETASHVYDRASRKTVNLATFGTDPEDLREACAQAEALLKEPAHLSVEARSHLTRLLQRLG